MRDSPTFVTEEIKSKVSSSPPGIDFRIFFSRRGERAKSDFARWFLSREWDNLTKSSKACIWVEKSNAAVGWRSSRYDAMSYVMQGRWMLRNERWPLFGKEKKKGEGGLILIREGVTWMWDCMKMRSRRKEKCAEQIQLH